jgi:serine/threonine protein kinase/Tol biopolymer transport system component
VTVTLRPGSRLGQYEILASLGAGGMGEVYRARDPKLNRDVALKVLPETFTTDADRIARFAREAQALAVLNHPNIGAIYGIEDSGTTPALVMELVDGEDLSQHIARGAIPLGEALPIARQIAEGLEAAHEQGIIHRDLKPANIKVRADGTVKVLDFGLAKALGAAGGGQASGAGVMESPTLTGRATQLGVILGTAAYMAPEQAKGKAVDRRADIWAFGAVLYEMLTGRRAFGGGDISDTLASVLKDAPDFGALPADVPPPVRRLLRRCLEKDPKRRLGSIADARLELDDAASGASEPGAAPAPPLPRPARWKTVLPWSLAALFALLAAFAGWRLLGGATPVSPITRFAITLQSSGPLSGLLLPAIALAPDGTRLVYVARNGATDQLHVRRLDQLEGKPIAGTEGGYGPFFSPDGQWIGFFASGKLRKISLNGGTAQTLWDPGTSNKNNVPLGGTWGPDDTIVFSPGYFLDLARVSASGGAARAFVPLAGARSFQTPQFLPGGKALLVTAVSNLGYNKTNVSAVSLDTGQRSVLVEGGFNARYAAGYLVYTSPESLMAAPFDPVKLELKGMPAPVLEGMSLDALDSFVGQFTLSDTGTLAYVPGDPRSADQTLVWIDRKGQTLPATGSRHNFEDMALSPDGQRAALTIEGPESDVWIFDAARDNFTRLTFGGGNRDPMWTPDGKRVVFESTKLNENMVMKSYDGSGSEQHLLPSPNGQGALSWPSDGKVLLFSQKGPSTGRDLWVLPFAEDKPGQPRPFVQTPADEEFGSFSPNGRWVAYQSDESGRLEVYVRPYPGPGGKSLISADGGYRPLWARSGRELFYRNGDKLMVVEVATEGAFTAGKPRVLFEAKHRDAFHDYGVTPDGQRFLMMRQATEAAAPIQIHVVLNWFEDLKQKVSARSSSR